MGNSVVIDYTNGPFRRIFHRRRSFSVPVGSRIRQPKRKTAQHEARFRDGLLVSSA